MQEINILLHYLRPDVIEMGREMGYRSKIKIFLIALESLFGGSSRGTQLLVYSCPKTSPLLGRGQGDRSSS